jgi:Family of unknown function (DUF6325)
MKGPIDYIVVGFDGLKFDGSIMRALGEAIEKGTIRLLALSVLAKDENGDVGEMNIADLGDEYLVEIGASTSNDLITDEDVSEVGALLPPNTAAGLLIIEHLWAIPLKQAIIDANGTLVAEGRIHPDAEDEITEGEGGQTYARTA